MDHDEYIPRLFTCRTCGVSWGLEKQECDCDTPAPDEAERWRRLAELQESWRAQEEEEGEEGQ